MANYQGKVAADLRYSSTHEWVKVQGNQATIGITDFAQHALGDIVFVDLPKVGQQFKKDQEFGAVESVKAASELIIPLSGKVIAVNKKLENSPEAINDAPYGEWMIQIELSSPSEFDELLTAEAYALIAK